MIVLVWRKDILMSSANQSNINYVWDNLLVFSPPTFYTDVHIETALAYHYSSCSIRPWIDITATRT